MGQWRHWSRLSATTLRPRSATAGCQTRWHGPWPKPDFLSSSCRSRSAGLARLSRMAGPSSSGSRASTALQAGTFRSSQLAVLPSDRSCPKRAREVLGDSGAIIAGGFNPPGTATRVDGGHRLSGRRPFMSGCQKATWFMNTGLVMTPQGPEAGPDGSQRCAFSCIRPPMAASSKRGTPWGCAGRGATMSLPTGCSSRSTVPASCGR